jgi:hypothetical protein
VKEMVKYDAARAALVACASTDEVLDWEDHAAACEAYARQAKDNEMRKLAVEIRMRAKRRLGELMAEQKAAGGMKVGRPKKNGVTNTPISLAEAGIDKNLAKEARAAAAMPPDVFEQAIETRKAAVDQPDFGRTEKAFDANAELLEHAAEAMAIIGSDDIAKAALEEAIKAKRETKAVSALYDALKGEVAAYKREISKWMGKAKASAVCKACKVNLERDDE